MLISKWPRFCMALLMALMLKPNGFAMLATVCSSWVFVNRATYLDLKSLWDYSIVPQYPVVPSWKEVSSYPVNNFTSTPSWSFSFSSLPGAACLRSGRKLWKPLGNTNLKCVASANVPWFKWGTLRNLDFCTLFGKFVKMDIPLLCLGQGLRQVKTVSTCINWFWVETIQFTRLWWVEWRWSYGCWSQR